MQHQVLPRLSALPDLDEKVLAKTVHKLKEEDYTDFYYLRSDEVFAVHLTYSSNQVAASPS